VHDRTANAVEVVWDIPDVLANTSSYGVRFLMTNGSTFASTYGFYYYSQGNFRLDPVSGGYLYGPAYSTAAAPTLGFVGSISAPSSTNLAYITPQAASDSISAGDTFVLGSSYYLNRFGYLNWADGQIGFAGVRFDLPTGTHYGWVQITKARGEFTLNGFGYNSTPGAASLPTDTREIPGDFDFDGNIDADDWAVLRDNILSDFSALTPEASYLLGDMDRNLLSDVRDFRDFQDSYELENGAGSFAAMVAAAAVPEPSSILLLAAGAAGLGMWRKKRAG
jgi:hypothetical protein